MPTNAKPRSKLTKLIKSDRGMSEGKMASDPPKVLISYSHDSPEHARRVLGLAERLRKDGVEAWIDQYTQDPDEGWIRWMRRKVKQADKVLLAFTETYQRRFEGEEEEGKGFGATFEGVIVTQALYESGGRNTKFRPVVFDVAAERFISDELRRFNHYRVDTPEGYEKLLRWVYEAPSIVASTIGQKPWLSPEPLPELFSTKLGESRAPTVPLETSAPIAAAREVALSNLPERNPFFTGRERVLAQLREALVAQGRAALSGLGGAGKTQTAVEYAHRYFDEYAYTLWAIADLRDSIVSGYVKLATLLELPEGDAQEQMLAVEAVKRWLGSHKGWLLMLDNADDLTMAREFIPAGRNGHVLLTTRAQAAGAIARRVEIQEMEKEEGVLFLLRRATCIAGDAVLEAASSADQVAAKEIVTQLDGLPLALDQAGAYIEETGCGLPGYLELYRSHALELLGHRGVLASDHCDPVATTWALSFENVEKANPAAAELLCFCAFLSPDGIPEEVFSEGAPELGPAFGAVAIDAFAFNNAISEILKYSLLRRDANARTLEIHRLVQAVLKERMDEATQRLWSERAVRAVGRAFPSVEFSTWAVCDRLVAQAHACAELINQWGFEFPEAARLLNQAGAYLYERGRYTDAEPLLAGVLAISEKAMGQEHPNVATSLVNLAALFDDQGQYAKAEPLYERALAIYEKALGTEHPEVATSLNNLALLYKTQGKYEKAEALYQRSLKIREKALWPEHPEVAASLYNLGALYHCQGRYAKAEPFYQRALAIREKVIGQEQADVASSLINLATLEGATGRYAQAEALYQRSLKIQEKALGPEHHQVAQSLNNLAGLYCEQGQYTKAEPLYQRALTILEKVLGTEHPHVVTSLENYAGLLRLMDRSDEAEPLESRARAIRRKDT
jgi:tetratricopeptide (TPR) repeat protein